MENRNEGAYQPDSNVFYHLLSVNYFSRFHSDKPKGRKFFRADIRSSSVSPFSEMNNSACQNKKGFTLIELLMVIAIIGILASIIMVNLTGAKTRATDARRMSEISQIASALEAYYAANGSYPNISADSRPSPTGFNWSTLSSMLGVQLPVDPNNGGNVGNCSQCGEYFYNGGDHAGQTFMLSTYLDNSANSTGSNQYGYYFSKPSGNCAISSFWDCL